MKKKSLYFSLGRIYPCFSNVEGLEFTHGHAEFLDALRDLVKLSIIGYGGVVYSSSPERVLLKATIHAVPRKRPEINIQYSSFPDNNCEKLHDFICILTSIIKCKPFGVTERDFLLENYVKIEGVALMEIIERGCTLVDRLPEETKEEIKRLLSSADRDYLDEMRVLIVSMLIVCGVTSVSKFSQAVRSNNIDRAVKIIDSQ